MVRGRKARLVRKIPEYGAIVDERIWRATVIGCDRHELALSAVDNRDLAALFIDTLGVARPTRHNCRAAHDRPASS
jgi:hypothetical protein